LEDLISAKVRNGWTADIDPTLAIRNSRRMLRLIAALALICTGCGVAEQPEWARTVSAYEVPLPTDADKVRFVQLLRHEAEAEGFHVDAPTRQELEVLSEVSRVTFSAAVWRGENDEESVASAADFEDRIGRVWLAFSLGRDPDRSKRFRERLLPRIMAAWPNTASLPIMPSGAIPLPGDLVRTPSGYVVNSSAAAKYTDEER
jgi:hypothetical protein